MESIESNEDYYNNIHVENPWVIKAQLL